MDTTPIAQFLCKANRAGYGNAETVETTESDGSHSITYTEDGWSFHDNYFGGEPFGGREVIFHNRHAVWMMTYFGGAVEKAPNIGELYSFLKSALLKFPEDLPLRGPSSFSDGDWNYTCDISGDMSSFIGKERIEFKNNVLFITHFNGGLVDIQ